MLGGRARALLLGILIGLGAAGAAAEERPTAGVGAVFTLEQRYLHAASEGDRATVLRALELGADSRAKDGLGRNAVVLAVRGQGTVALVVLLAERGVPLDLPDSGGRTAVSYAAGKGDLSMLRELESRGAEPDRPDQQQRSPLHHAVARNRLEAARHLLERGAAVDRTDLYGDTPLLVACARGHDAMARLLLEAGADPGHRDREGRGIAERAAPGAPTCRAGGPTPGAHD